jgi:outer membrane protein TolC
MTQTIWDGGVTKEQKKITRASAFAETQKVKMDLYSLREQVSILFFGSILSDKQVENASILQKDLEAKLVRTKNLKDGGLAIGNNLLVLEARLLELEQQINDAQTRKKAALEALSILTGEENMRQANLIWNETSPIPDITTINRPELDYFQAQSSWIDASEGLIKAKNMLKIGAFASAGVGRPALNFLSNRLEPYFIGGVQIRIPLTHFYSQANRIEKQELLINKEKLAVQEKNLLWLTKVKAASQEAEIKRFDKLLENDKKLIDIRMQIVKTAEVQLENGIITPNDYLTEANSLDLARQNLALHEIQRQQAIAALIITLGTKN